MNTSDEISASASSDLPLKPQTPRYHAFDCVRALAMLLGVFYHWQYVNGSMGMASGPKGSVDHWLHSFRMALFFLISGFFASMMLGKYGVFKYLTRRWWRVGMPFVAAILLFATFRVIQLRYDWAAPPNAMMGGMGGGMGGMGAGFGAPTGGGMGMQSGMGFGAPAGGMGFGAPAGGMGGGFGAPAGGMGGFPTGGGGFPGAPAMVNPQPQAPMELTTSDFFSMGGPDRPWAEAILKKFNMTLHRSEKEYVRFKPSDFQLQHLWFLWYLLVFCTVAPVIAIPLYLVLKKILPLMDKIGQGIVRWNLFPFALALASLWALMYARGTTFDNKDEWALSNPQGFSAVFPDFIHQFKHFKDIYFYFTYFLFGWWFFRLRGALPAVAKPWIFNLFIGVVAFAVSQSLHDKYHPSAGAGGMMGMGFGFGAPSAAQTVAIPWYMDKLAFLLYAVGAAYSGFALLGLFQKYLDRPTKFGKYFTDTMLWVYLTQLAIIPYVGGWIDYNNTSWWEASIGGVVLVTAISLVLFEVFVRHTPLVYIFGPASLGRKPKNLLHSTPSTSQSAASTPATSPA